MDRTVAPAIAKPEPKPTFLESLRAKQQQQRIRDEEYRKTRFNEAVKDVEQNFMKWLKERMDALAICNHSSVHVRLSDSYLKVDNHSFRLHFGSSPERSKILELVCRLIKQEFGDAARFDWFGWGVTISW